MKEPIHDYIKVGLVHFMAYPECMGGEGPVLETVSAIANDPFFEAIEITRIADADTQEQVRSLLDQVAMDVCFGAQPMLLGGGLDLNDADDDGRKKAIQAVKVAINQAGAMGIDSVAVLSGKVSEDYDAAKGRLVDSLKILSEYGAHRDVRIVLETFDQVPFAKNCLIGPTKDAVDVSKAVREDYPSFGIMLDLSHLPLIGEDAETALKSAGEHLVHVHIGNCAMDDPNHPAYGDNHPRFSAPGTRNGVEELADFLRVLLDSGYFSGKHRKIVSFEVKPMPGESSDAVIAGSKRTLLEAWRRV